MSGTDESVRTSSHGSKSDLLVVRSLGSLVKKSDFQNMHIGFVIQYPLAKPSHRYLPDDSIVKNIRLSASLSLGMVEDGGKA
jgi:hypothetical protein